MLLELCISAIAHVRMLAEKIEHIYMHIYMHNKTQLDVFTCMPQVSKAWANVSSHVRIPGFHVARCLGPMILTREKEHKSMKENQVV